jgi:hypothetical protein
VPYADAVADSDAMSDLRVLERAAAGPRGVRKVPVLALPADRNGSRISRSVVVESVPQKSRREARVRGNARA